MVRIYRSRVEGVIGASALPSVIVSLKDTTQNGKNCADAQLNTWKAMETIKISKIPVHVWKVQPFIISSNLVSMNTTSFDLNVTQLSFLDTKGYEALKVIFFVLAFLFFSFFTYFIIVLLIVYFTTPHVQENARYVLFAHMLINDTLYLIFGLFLSVVYTYRIYIPITICYVIVTLATITFKVTPFNLAIMALERYIAICFPLRHIVFCTSQRSYVVIAVMWFFGLLPNIADFIVLMVSVEKNFFSKTVLCRQESLIVQPLQSSIRSFYFVGSLILVALVILFTYVRVIVVARKTKSKSSSAWKAGRTLMLHAIQLLLCLLSLTTSITESYDGDYVIILIVFNFLVFMCLPRLLSPLIYGIRDEVFSKCIRKMYSSKR